MAAHKAKVSPTAPSPSDPLAARVLRTIQHYAMLTEGDEVLMGISGGPDSMAMAHLLHSLASRWKLRIGLAHLDHGLRPDAAGQEAALVESLADRLGLACYKAKIEPFAKSGSLEEQLRLRRYAFFHDIAVRHGYNKIALGHQADDNAEAVLLHLLRGSASRGLAGIPPMRAPGIVRPMIATRREEILAYLERHAIVFARDASNADLSFERNRVRHELLPLLREKFNSNLVEVLNRTAAIFWEEECWWEAHLQPYLSQVIGASGTERLDLRVDALASFPRPVQRRILRMALRQWQGHLRRLGAEHIESLIGLLGSKSTGQSLHLPVKLTVERIENRLRFHHGIDPGRQSSPTPPQPYRYDLPSPLELPRTLEIPEAGCRLHFSVSPNPGPQALSIMSPQEIILDLAQLPLPLSLRSFIPGDRLRPFGFTGSRKLKALFVAHKVPRPQRHRIPLLLGGSDIIWVVGLRRSNVAPVLPTTSRVLRVRVEESEG